MLPQFAREEVSSSDGQFREVKFWELCLQTMFLFVLPEELYGHCDARRVLRALVESSCVLVSSPKESMKTPKLSQQPVTFNQDPTFVEVLLVTYLPF